MSNLHIDKKLKNGVYVSDDECQYDTASEYYQCEFFGLCGCGMPDENLEYIRDGLSLIDKRIKTEMTLEEVRAQEIAVFGNKNAAYFFYYWADKSELTEHGSSVPGWLTDKGEEVLEDLIQITKEEELCEE